jgi:hypothetical protein
MRGRGVETETEAVPALLIGSILPARLARPDVTLSSELSATPTLHDYGVILARYSNESFHTVDSTKWREWDAFLARGGTAIILGVDASVQRYNQKLVKGSLPRLVEQHGRNATWIRGTPLYEGLASWTRVHWDVIVHPDDAPTVANIGRNSAGDVISFRLRVGNGEVFLLPAFEGPGRETLALSLLDRARRHYLTESDARRAPKWASDIVVGAERELLAQQEILSSRLLKISRAKRVLYEDGKTLSRECASMLREILEPAGFRVEWTEEGGDHDVELEGSTMTIVVEVRGAAGQIDVGLARQLMDHSSKKLTKTAMKKGVIVGNPHRLLPPSQRGRSFTPQCESLARSNQFCLMTACQLLDFYDRFLTSGLKAEQLISMIMSTSGVLESPPRSQDIPVPTVPASGPGSRAF